MITSTFYLLCQTEQPKLTNLENPFMHPERETNNRETDIEKIRQHSSTTQHQYTSFNINQLIQLWHQDQQQFINYTQAWLQSEPRILLAQAFAQPLDSSTQIFILQRQVISELIQLHGQHSWGLIERAIVKPNKLQIQQVLLVEAFSIDADLIHYWQQAGYFDSLNTGLGLSFIEQILTENYIQARLWLLEQPNWISSPNVINAILNQGIVQQSVTLRNDLALINDLNKQDSLNLLVEVIVETNKDRDVDYIIQQVFHTIGDNSQNQAAYSLAFNELTVLDAEQTLQLGFDYFGHEPTFYDWLLNQDIFYSFSQKQDVNYVLSWLRSTYHQQRFITQYTDYLLSQPDIDIDWYVSQLPSETLQQIARQVIIDSRANS
ncbi:hypothetical protein C2869_07665 [Saccharobesus litoralis]|uniref:Uncharacterized protein n=2 Tax=Saccharobesus litoralis TaxID=2172099 RepID=A0A2S0VQ28_9ALTE|nr:hypothetical protein C2869_07665 [Saccharobesus litoralis]